MKTVIRHGTRKLRRTAPALLAAALVLPVAAVSGQRAGISGDVEVAGLLDEIEAATAARERLDRQVGELSSQHEGLRNSLHRHLRALYRVTRAGRAPLQGGFDAVLRHVSRVKRLRRLVVSEAQDLAGMSGRSRALRAESGKAALTLDRARKRLHEVQERGSSAMVSSADRFESVFSTRGGSYRQPQESFYGLRVVDPVPTQSFAASRGRLASPISGEVRVAEARRPESDGPGLEFQAPAGTPVRAVAAGRVAFSDTYGSYGRIVILDHGDGYYTVYGGLGGIEVRVGDDLSRRARIGAIGSDLSPSALFFEVRHGTRTLPPHDWLGF
jgi:septal ring factor EnvC (AmiA/AmiB activator)